MSVFVTSCRFLATAGGTGSFVVASAVAGHVTPNDDNALDKVYHYYAQTPDGSQTEEGHGAYSVTTQTLLRTIIDKNSDGTFMPINFAVAPEVDVFPSPTPLEVAGGMSFDAMAYNGLQINGSMDVSQEKGTNTTTVSGQYIMDGWLLGINGTMAVSGFQVPSVSAFAGYSNYLTITVQTAQASLGAGDYTSIFQAIEGYRLACLAWGTSAAKPLTIGFWTAHHRTGLYSGSVRNYNGSRSCPFAYTQNVADTPEFKVVTIPGDTTGTWLTTNGIGIYLSFMMAAGTSYLGPVGVWAAANYPGATGQVNGAAATSDVFRLTGVIVLPGNQVISAARSPFMMRSYDKELPICRRYWQFLDPVLMGGSNVSGGLFYYSIYFTSMRTIPTVALRTTPGIFNCSYAVGSQITTNSCRFDVTVTSAGGGPGYIQSGMWTLDARL